ncbi:MAG: hypothetical protein WCA35_18350, partial [Kovacikia sp.]
PFLDTNLDASDLFQEDLESSDQSNWADALNQEFTEEPVVEVESLFQEKLEDSLDFNLDSLGETGITEEALSGEEIDFNLDPASSVDEELNGFANENGKDSETHFEITEQEKAILEEMSRAGGSNSYPEDHPTSSVSPTPPPPNFPD